MILEYANGKLRKILEDERLIKKYYGKNYDKLKNRLAELRAAQNLSEIPELPPPRRHKLKGKYSDCWGIDYSRNHRIILRPEGRYDIEKLESINEVKIIDLVDYH